MLAIDNFLIRITKSVLDFLNDWLSISQKQVEKFLIGVFAVLLVPIVVTGASKIMMIFFGIMLPIILIGMFTRHSLTASLRNKWRIENYGYRVFNTLLVIVFGADFAVTSFHNFIWFAAFMALIIFDYTIVCVIDGERGRKRKMTLNEITKMFGTEWIEKPISVGV